MWNHQRPHIAQCLRKHHSEHLYHLCENHATIRPSVSSTKNLIYTAMATFFPC
eukprot:c25245_g3_i1 orf=2-157(-)